MPIAMTSLPEFWPGFRRERSHLTPAQAPGAASPNERPRLPKSRTPLTARSLSCGLGKCSLSRHLSETHQEAKLKSVDADIE